MSATLTHGYRYEIIAGDFDENDREVETVLYSVTVVTKSDSLSDIAHKAIIDALNAETDRLIAEEGADIHGIMVQQTAVMV